MPLLKRVGEVLQEHLQVYVCVREILKAMIYNQGLFARRAIPKEDPEDRQMQCTH